MLQSELRLRLQCQKGILPVKRAQTSSVSSSSPTARPSKIKWNERAITKKGI